MLTCQLSSLSISSSVSLLSFERQENATENKENMEEKIGKKISLYENDLYESIEVKEKTIHIMVFRLTHEWYGIEITKIKEVSKVDKITFLPSSPNYITGITNLRGNILSVTDLKRIFDLPPEEITNRSRLLNIILGVLETSLLVDEVTDTIEVPTTKIDPPFATISPEKAKYLEGECMIDGKLIGILSVEKILEKH